MLETHDMTIAIPLLSRNVNAFLGQCGRTRPRWDTPGQIISKSNYVGLALGVENRVKQLSKTRKEALIRDNTRIDEIIKQVGSQISV